VAGTDAEAGKELNEREPKQAGVKTGKERKRAASGAARNQPAAAGNWIPPFPVSPPGKSRGGRVPPTPRTLPAGKRRRQASMLRLPPQEGFQSAPLKSPLRDPPALQGGGQADRMMEQVGHAGGLTAGADSLRLKT